MISGPQDTDPTNLASLVTVSLDIKIEVEVVDAALVAHAGGDFDPRLRLPDMHGKRQVRVFAAGRKRGASKHLDRLRLDQIHMKVTSEKIEISPCHMDVISFEPHTLLILQGQFLNREIAPDVAADAHDLQPSETSHLEAGGGGFDQESALRQKHPETRAHQDGPQKNQGGKTAQKGRAKPPLGLRRDFPLERRQRAQKLCPMLR